MVFFWEKWLRTKSYGWSIFSILWTYSLIFLLVSVTTAVLFHSQVMDLPVTNAAVWTAFWTYNTAISQVANYIFWLLVVVLTLIALQVNDKYGPGVFGSFLLGKYFHPKREERIFHVSWTCGDPPASPRNWEKVLTLIF